MLDNEPLVTDELDVESAADVIEQAQADIEASQIDSEGQENVPESQDSLDTETQKMESELEAAQELSTTLDESSDFHTVLPKENLYRISLKYNVKIKKLLEWNNLTDASAIQKGTKLRVREPNTNE
jgi:type IV pilus assembly protein PilF